MSLTQVLEMLGQERIDGDGAIEASLRQAIEGFTDNRMEAISSIRDIQTRDPTEFVLAAARLLNSPTIGRVASEYIRGVISSANAVVGPLLDARTAREAALSVAREMAETEPRIDARLMQKMLENADGSVAAIPAEVALRVLWLLDKFSDCSRVTLYLVQLSRHPSAEVRSKAALLVGRGNLNLMRVKQFLGSDDGRTRANAVESLWGLNTPQARELFREAAADPNRRVCVNALVGLCKAGEPNARLKLIELSRSDDSVSRRAAAWAMGQVGDPEFATTLDALSEAEDQHLRNMAKRSRAMLRTPPSEHRRKAAQAPAMIGLLKPCEAVPDLHSYPTRPSRVEGINPSGRGEDDTTRDLRSYPLASSSHLGR